jgi:hemoglobin-like flavoprotein
MDSEMIARLENSFKLLAPRAQELVDRFYAHLFSAHPEVRSMFPEQMSEQKKKLLASLVFVVQNLRKPQEMQSPLMDMGARHLEYGTMEEHYPVVRDTLVTVMSEMAGKAWNDQLTDDWNTAINHVASVMISGAREKVAAGA